MSRAPLPSLRSLFAAGGAPLALVRHDEQLAERLVRIARDLVPPIVEQGARATQVLTAVPDIAQFPSSIDAHADESSDASEARNDERAASPRRRSSSTVSSAAPHEMEKAGHPRGPVAEWHRVDQLLKEEKRAARPELGAAGEERARTSRAMEHETTRKENEGERLAKLLGDLLANVARRQMALGRTPAVRRKTDAAGVARSVVREVAKSAAGVARILSQFDKDATTSRGAKEGERQATRDKATTRERVRDALGAIDAMTNLVRRLERRGAKEYDARANKAFTTRNVATDDHARERRPSASGGVAMRGSAPRDGERSGVRAESRRGDERSGVTMPAMSEPVAPAGGFRGLARWAAEQSGDAELSTAIERGDVERAPMLQQLHATRRGWTLSGDELAWTLDSAARNEGLDLDEVAS
ncbi:MAG: hypothetical protein IT359_03820 [Gemmatimonadaceae bacterium]|nr:hypothetical protein [Gemmatimonadaceae bacterium]